MLRKLITSLSSRIILSLCLALVFAFWLVPTGRAQGNFQQSANVGINRLKVAGPLIANQNYIFNILLPANATSETFIVESVSTNNITYSISFATASLELPTATGTVLSCTKGLFNPSGAQFAGTQSSTFASQTAFQNNPEQYTCPFPPTQHLIINFLESSASAQASFYLIVNTAQNSWLPQQTSNFTYTPITTSTNTLVKSTPGTLHLITITQPGATANSITIIDSASGTCSPGTTVATIPTAQLPSTMVPVTIFFDTTFLTGICIQTAGTTSPQLVVAFK